jgi:cysteine-rich repeat protein
MNGRNRYLTTFTLVAGLVCLYGGCNLCGNGKLDTGEQCDDSNTIGTDGCSGSCKIEGGYTCSGQPSVCTPMPGATVGTNCKTGTATDFSTALTKYASQWAGLKAKASQLGFKPDGPYDNVLVCDEGAGTTQWIAHIQGARTREPGAGLILRPDIPSAPVTMYYSTGSKDADKYMVTPYLIFHTRNDGPVDIKDLNGNALPPPEVRAAGGLADHFFPRSR